MLKYILPVLLLSFTACELNDEELLESIVGPSESVPEGTYVSQCVLSQSDSSSSIFTLILSDESYTLQEDTYSDSACSVDEVLGVPGEPIEVDLPGPNLGDGYSFFTNDEDLKVPYFYDNGTFVLGEPQEGLPSGEDDFSGFESNFKAGVIPVFELQD